MVRLRASAGDAYLWNSVSSFVSTSSHLSFTYPMREETIRSSISMRYRPSTKASSTAPNLFSGCPKAVQIELLHGRGDGIGDGLAEAVGVQQVGHGGEKADSVAAHSLPGQGASRVIGCAG
jgi:hypothetical protein